MGKVLFQSPYVNYGVKLKVFDIINNNENQQWRVSYYIDHLWMKAC